MRVRFMFCLKAWLVLVPSLVASLPSWSDASAVVEGTVTFEAVTPQQSGVAYRTRTRSPIQPPDTPRAVVWLARKDGNYPVAEGLPLTRLAQVAQVAQKGYQFRPGILAVRVGSSVVFPNRDDEFHSVFSYSQTKRFDLGRFRKDEDSPPVVFDQPGVVKIYCEIHRHMRAILLVLETPWFTTTDDAGHFRLEGIPPGEYEANSYLPGDKQLNVPVTVGAGALVHLDLGV